MLRAAGPAAQLDVPGRRRRGGSGEFGGGVGGGLTGAISGGRPIGVSCPASLGRGQPPASVPELKPQNLREKGLGSSAPGLSLCRGDTARGKERGSHRIVRHLGPELREGLRSLPLCHPAGPLPATCSLLVRTRTGDQVTSLWFWWGGWGLTLSLEEPPTLAAAAQPGAWGTWEAARSWLRPFALGLTQSDTQGCEFMEVVPQNVKGQKSTGGGASYGGI